MHLWTFQWTFFKHVRGPHQYDNSTHIPNGKIQLIKIDSNMYNKLIIDLTCLQNIFGMFCWMVLRNEIFYSQSQEELKIGDLDMMPP
jgi:hypothetical protein